MNALRWLWVRGRLAAIGLALGAMSMLVAFLVVYTLARSLAPDPKADPAAVHRARMLRSFSNELVSLCNEFHQRSGAGVETITPLNRRWIERDFRRDVQFLEQRMNDTMLDDCVEFAQLRATAARCSSMARHADDRALRDRTLREVTGTVDSVELYIERLGVGVMAGPPRVLPRLE